MSSVMIERPKSRNVMSTPSELEFGLSPQRTAKILPRELRGLDRLAGVNKPITCLGRTR